MKEVELQYDIIRSVRAAGGYARKWSSRFQSGVPDLVISLPPFAPCFAEVKDLKVVGERFKRKLDVTPKQRLELKALAQSGCLAFLLVGFRWGTKQKHFLVGMYWTAEYLSSETLHNLPVSERSPSDKLYAISNILEEMGAPRLTSSKGISDDRNSQEPTSASVSPADSHGARGWI